MHAFPMSESQIPPTLPMCTLFHILNLHPHSTLTDRKCPEGQGELWLAFLACRILVPWPGVSPEPPALQVRSLNHLTAREEPSPEDFLNGRASQVVPTWKQRHPQVTVSRLPVCNFIVQRVFLHGNLLQH